MGVNESGVKLSKRQLVRLQQKKAKQKKIIGWVATSVITIAIVVALIISSIPQSVYLEGSITAKGGKDGKYEIDNSMFAYLLYDNLYQYSSYLTYYGYDTTKTLKNQTTSCGFDKSKTWYEYFCSITINQFDQYIAFASAAEAEGMSLDADDIKEIDDLFKDYETTAYKKGYRSITKYLEAVYCPGITSAAVRRVVELEMLASKYVEKFVEDLKGTFSAEQIQEYREKNPGSFMKVDYVSYTFTEEYVKDATTEQKKEVDAALKLKAEALKGSADLDAFKNAIKEIIRTKENKKPEDEIDITKYITEGEYYDETKAAATATKDYYTWAYNAERVANDTYISESKTSTSISYTVYMIEGPAYYDQYNTQSVRHILFAVDTTLTGTKLEDAFTKAKTEAEKVLEEYNKGDKTAEKFGELAKEHTDDSNGEKGGLYENVSKGAMVEEFENWIYDEARAEGDVDLVKTKYGWHIMYYVGEGAIAWETVAEAGLQEEAYNEKLEELLEEYEVTYDYKVMFEIP